ncbi:MAG: cbb3-type cytochrome c oxidase N-terminal domain-containing protein [Cyclobacteriaceae bacterium]
MFKHYFEGIYNIHIWPVISFTVFFVFFIALLIWVWKVDKGYIQKMKQLPLDPDHEKTKAEIDTDHQSNKTRRSFFSRFKFQLRSSAILLIALCWPVLSWGQTETAQDVSYTIILAMVSLVIVLVLIMAIYLVKVLNLVLRREKERQAAEQGIPLVEEPSWWSRLDARLTEAVPVEEEDTVLLDHDYDGIRELDNHLPPWWKYGFYISIVFAVVYVLIYHVFGSLPMQEQEYQAELAKAAAVKEARLAAEPEVDINESNIAFSDDPAHLDNGQKTFERQCASCHAQSGGGGIGPNLTDDYWIHGGSISSIFTIIKNGGRPGKGMIPWESLLSSTQMRDVASYIVTLQGTNPPNAKAQEGEKYVPEATTEPERVPVDTVTSEASNTQ